MKIREDLSTQKKCHLGLGLRQADVGVYHSADELLKRGVGLPAEGVASFGRVAEKVIDFGWTEVERVDFDVFFPIEVGVAEGFIEKLADGIGFAGGNDKIAGFGVLQHHPHGFDVIAGEAPVAAGIEIAEIEFFLQTGFDSAEGAGDFAGDEGFAAARGFVVEENAVGNKEVIGFAVIDGVPVSGDFGDGVGTAGIEGCQLTLRRFGSSEHLRGASLIEAHLTTGVMHVIADGIEETQRASGDRIGGVFGVFKRDFDVRLRPEIVDFVGLGDFENAAKASRISEIAVMEIKAATGLMGVLIDVVDATSVEAGTAADDAVDGVTFSEEKLT